MAVAEQFTGAVAPELSPAAELKPPWVVKFLYSFGQTIESGYIAVAAFVFFYYTAVLGLSGSLVGLALAISMGVDAFVDPLVGSLSDNVRSKFGRRLPLMVIGAPVMGLSLALLFAPPAGLAAFVLFFWLTLSKLALRGFASMFNLPFFALGAEMADGYVERSSVVAYRTVAGIFTGLVITVLAYSVFFAGTGGLQKAAAYPAFGVTMGVLCFAGGAVCCLSVWRYASRLPQPTTPPKPLFRALLPEVAEVFRNSSFRTLFFSALIAYVAAGLNAAFNNHAYVFVWQVKPQSIQLITYGYLVGIALGVPLTPVLLRFMEKRSAVIVGLAMVLLAWSVLPVLRVARLFTPIGDAAVPWLAANVAIAGVGIGFMAIAYPSMMADAADEHEVRFGHRREGLYFSGLGFASKAATGLGQLVAGVALDVMRFPKEAGKQVGVILPEPLMDKIIIAWGPVAAALGLVALLLLIPYRISRVRHEDIATALKAKRRLDVSEGRSS
ncbi:MFS transporter [Phenylobacterium sp.]|uniref:MFS transporter n=1 Tax=Phenylobacterium sp. TaxID=1871053 RepID=UPI0025FCEA7B|nr:MFS transporter [Phenylobacterium sp.]